jgi:hypothetical protein
MRRACYGRRPKGAVNERKVRVGLHFSRLTWPFPFLVRLGWATCKTPNPDLGSVRSRVFLLRGNGIFFSGGFSGLCTALRRCGVWTEDLRCVGDWWACRQLIADKRAGRLQGPIIFVGHSCGGRYALYGARALQQVGLTVDLVIGLDVAFPPVVPGNVKRAINLYIGGWRLYPSGRFRAEPGTTTQVENIDLTGDAVPVSARGLHHLNVTNSTDVRSYILQRILETIGESRIPVE